MCIINQRNLEMSLWYFRPLQYESHFSRSQQVDTSVPCLSYDNLFHFLRGKETFQLPLVIDNSYAISFLLLVVSLPHSGTTANSACLHIVLKYIPAVEHFQKMLMNSIYYLDYTDFQL
jgi:hypothetical protein